MKNKICALVVTYDRLKQLKNCLEQINNQTYPCDVFVVNNNKNDDTEKFLKDNNINHYTTDENIGGSGGFNIGLKKIVEMGYEYAWLLDDDSIPNVDALEKLMIQDEYLNHDYGFLSSKVLWIDGSIHNMNRHHYKKKVSDNLYEINKATFVSFLIKTETIKKFGYPIKDFFIWGDDVEYSIRITNHIKAYAVVDSIVVHNTETNIGSNIALDDIKNLDRYYFAYRNEAYLYKKNGIKGMVYFIPKCIFNIIKILLLSDHKKERLECIKKAVNDSRKFNPEYEKF